MIKFKTGKDWITNATAPPEWPAGSIASACATSAWPPGEFASLAALAAAFVADETRFEGPLKGGATDRASG